MAWFWWLLALFVLVMWVAALVNIIQRRHTMSGGKVAAWLLVILIFPVLGALLYFLINGAASDSRGPSDAQTLG